MNIKNLLKMKKVLVSAACVLAAVLLVLLFLCIKQNKISSVKVESTVEAETSKLIAENKAARKGIIKEKGEACFKFNQNQRKLFASVYEKNETAALIVRVEIKPLENQKELLTTGADLPFNFGILYSEDYDKKGRRTGDLNSKISVYANLSKKLSYSDEEPLLLDLSMAVPKSDSIENSTPVGFFVNSSIHCRIVSVCIAPALIGFDVSQKIAFYGFSSNGGFVDFSNSSVDFSGAGLVFPLQNTRKTNMPEIIVTLNKDSKFNSTFDESIRTKINVGGERIYIKNVKTADKMTIPTAALKSPFNLIDISENKEAITSMIMQSVPFNSDEKTRQAGSEVFIPVKSDPGLIISYNKDNWRVKDYEVFEWDRFPGILLFDFADYDIQDNFLRRLAFFVEKQGYKGKLWSNAVLEGKHGYNAHDYSAESLAAFFNKATEESFTLNKEEETLKKILIVNGLLIEDGTFVKAGKGGIVSISQESNLSLRAKLLAHEGWHTLFFKDEEFRNFVAAVFYTMDASSREFLFDFFRSQPSLGYDTEDEYLMNNEFMAYIMQQRLSEVGEYFASRGNLYSVRVFTPELAQYVRDTNGKGFEDAAVILNDYVFDEYGLMGGNIALVMR